MCLVIEEPVQELSIEWVTARKVHRCTECRRTIEPGERYERMAYIDIDGDGVHQNKTCLHCRQSIALGSALTGCPQAWMFEMVWHRAEEDGYMADILEHDLLRRDRFRVLRCVAGARRGWRWSDGALMDPPSVPEREAP